MAESVPVSEVMTLVRNRTDQANSTFITDTELISYIDLSNIELYNKLIKANSTYFLSETTINIVANQDTYALPSDFYKVQGVDFEVSNNRSVSARPFSFEERNRKNYLGNVTRQYRYIIRGDNIQFLPMPVGAEVVTLHYTPITPNISASTDTLPSVNGGFRYIVADVCRMIAIKEETDPSLFVLELQKAEQNIMEAFTSRDEGYPQTVTDVDKIDDYFLVGDYWW